MTKRNARKTRFTLERLEGRLSLSSMSPGGPPSDHGEHHGGSLAGTVDNGHWEPKPIGHGSTRPNVPSGPVRWMGGGAGDHDDHHGGRDGSN